MYDFAHKFLYDAFTFVFTSIVVGIVIGWAIAFWKISKS